MMQTRDVRQQIAGVHGGTDGSVAAEEVTTGSVQLVPQLRRHTRIICSCATLLLLAAAGQETQQRQE